MAPVLAGPCVPQTDSGPELCPPAEAGGQAVAPPQTGPREVGPDQLSDPKIPSRNTAMREENRLQETWVTLQVILYFLII